MKEKTNYGILSEETSNIFPLANPNRGWRDWNERGTYVIIGIGNIFQLCYVLTGEDRMHVFDFLPLGTRTLRSGEVSLSLSVGPDRRFLYLAA
jgi:hypothetical protein